MINQLINYTKIMSRKSEPIIKDREAVVDFKEALRFYEYKNEGHELKKGLICKSTGVSYQTLANWSQKGNKLLGFILSLHEATGYPLEKIIKDITNEKK